MSSIILDQSGVPPIPAANFVTMFPQGDNLFQIDSSGLISQLGGGLTSVDLAAVVSPVTIEITNTGGDNASIPLADAVNAGAAAPGVNSAALSAIQSIIAGTNITIDNTDPQNPIVSTDGVLTQVDLSAVSAPASVEITNTAGDNATLQLPSAGNAGVIDEATYNAAQSALQSVTAAATSGILVDATDPQNPDISQTIYKGVTDEAAVLALNPTAELGSRWRANDVNIEYQAVTNLDAIDAWQGVSVQYDPVVDSYCMTKTQDGHQLDLGREVFFNAYNANGSGADPEDPRVFLSVGAKVGEEQFQDVIKPVASDLDPRRVFGINTTSMQPGDRGKITTYGYVNEVNTSAWGVNDVLYVSPTVAGELTNVEPGINAYAIAKVLKSDAVSGILFINSIGTDRSDPAAIETGTFRLNLTADPIVVPAGSFLEAIPVLEGTTPSATVVVVVPDSSIVGAGTDHLGTIVVEDTTIQSGERTSQIEFEVNSAGGGEKIYLEVYLADANGNLIDSGTGVNPVTDFPGITPYLVMETTLLDSDANDVYKQEMRGLLPSNFTVPANHRGIFHFRCQKVGTAGGDKTFTLYFGSDHDSFVTLIDEGGVQSYDELDDTPASKAGAALKIPRVNLAEASHEYTDEYSKWLYPYVSGEYEKWTMTRVGVYTMMSNTKTSDYPAPIPVGDPAYLMDSAVFSTLSNVSSIYSGHRIVFSEPGYVKTLRVQISNTSPTTDYRVVVIDNTDPQNPVVEIINNPDLTENGWAVVAASNYLVVSGTELIIYVDALDSGASSGFTGGWLNGGTSNSGAPAAESFNRRTQNNIVRIDKTDLDTVDRSTELAGVIAGSTLRFVETLTPSNFLEYETTGPAVDQGTYLEYPTQLLDSGGSIGVGVATTLTATIPVPSSTQYRQELGFWVGNQPDFATITGFLEFDGVDQPGNDDTGFGVDFEFQKLEKSDDWDVVSISGAGSSGGGSGGPSTATLQSAYDNGAQIETSTANGAVTLKRGTAADSDAVLVVRNAADGFAHAVTGTGKMLVADTVYVGTGGVSNQGQFATTIGPFAGTTNQGISAFAGGSGAGATNQGAGAIALGPNSGSADQGGGAIAIGNNVGQTSQGGQGIILSTVNGANDATDDHIIISTPSADLTYTAGTNTWTFGQSIDAPNFNYLGLSDTDDTNYTGKIGYAPIVNPAGTGLILADPATAGTGSQMETLPYVTVNSQAPISQGIALCTAITVTRGFVSNGLLIDIVSGSVAGDIEFGLYRISAVTPGNYELVSKARVTLAGNVSDQGVNEIDWDTTGAIEDGLHYVAILNPSGQSSLNSNLRALNIAGGNSAAKFTSTQSGLTTLPAVINSAGVTANGFWAGLK